MDSNKEAEYFKTIKKPVSVNVVLDHKMSCVAFQSAEKENS